jgi:intracellular multiplication protein IcmJ
MTSRPLTSTPSLWRLPFGHFSEADTKNRGLRTRILERDKYQCCDCSLSFKTHMEVRNLNDDHEDNSEKNLACVCPFCHLRDHLGPTGFAGAGIIIGAPALTQGQINTLALSVWYVQSRIEKNIDIRHSPEAADANSDEAWRQRLLTVATTMWKDLEFKSTRWASVYSPLITEPDVLGGILNELSINAPESYANRDTLLHGLHVLPSREAFEVQCKDWFELFDKTRPLSSWVKGMDAFMDRISSNPTDFFANLSKSIRAATKIPSSGLARPADAPTNPEQIMPPRGTPGGGVGKRYAD